MRGPTLFLITAFAASVASAPLPITPASAVASPEPLMAREALDAALSPVLDNLKRQLLERLEDVAPVKRSPTADKRYKGTQSTDTMDKRNAQQVGQGSLAGTELQRRQGGEVADQIAKRDFDILDSPEKRDFDILDSPEKRDFDILDSPEKRDFDILDSPEKRDFDILDSPEKRDFDILDSPEKRDFDILDSPEKRDRV